MKKFCFLVAICAMCLSVSAQEVETTTDNTTETEQTDGKKEKKKKKPSKFGNFMRRLGESATGINMSNEFFVAMEFELQQHISITLDSCYGDPTNGLVFVQLRFMPKTQGRMNVDDVKQSAQKVPIVAADAKGNGHEGKCVDENGDALIKGVATVKVFAFQLPTSWTAIEVINLPYYFNFNQGGAGVFGSQLGATPPGPIQIRNIPITWAQQ